MYILNIHIHAQKIALYLSKKKSKQQVAHQVAADPAGRTPAPSQGTATGMCIALPETACTAARGEYTRSLPFFRFWQNDKTSPARILHLRRSR